MATNYKAILPLVIARVPNGSQVYLYEGDPVPDLADGELQRLKDGGFVATEAAVEKAILDGNAPTPVVPSAVNPDVPNAGVESPVKTGK